MADRISKEQRSFIMSKIKGTNTSPELKVRKYLFSFGYRYRIHVKKLPGTPDIVLKKYKTIVNVNGCFFHGHNNCKHFKIPKTNTEFWTGKIKRNKERDLTNNELLAKLGWNIVTIWECELGKNNIEKTMERLVANLNNNLS